MTQQVITQSLYDDDFLLWTEDTAKKLRARDFEHLDLDNLIEEIESLGRAEKRELTSRLLTLIEHILKHCYVNLPECYRGWQLTILEQRSQIEQLLIEIPSLKSCWDDSFAIAFGIALKKVKAEYTAVTFPNDWQFNHDVESLLNMVFWESNRNGSV